MIFRANQALLVVLAALAGLTGPQQLYPTPESMNAAKLVCAGRLTRIEFAEHGKLDVGGRAIEGSWCDATVAVDDVVKGDSAEPQVTIRMMKPTGRATGRDLALAEVEPGKRYMFFLTQDAAAPGRWMLLTPFMSSAVRLSDAPPGNISKDDAPEAKVSKHLSETLRHDDMLHEAPMTLGAAGALGVDRGEMIAALRERKAGLTDAPADLPAKYCLLSMLVQQGDEEAHVELRRLRSGAPAPAPAAEVAAAPVPAPAPEPAKQPKEAGPLLLDVSPGEASVFIDGREAGKSEAGSALQIKGLAAGPHMVRIARDGFKPFEEEIELEPGAEEKISVKLEPDKPGVPEWAQVSSQQTAFAEKLGVPVAFENSAGIRMVIIPPGEFTMGTADAGEYVARFGGKAAAYKFEQPAHKATVADAYYISIHELTCAQQARVAKTTAPSGEEGALPVGNVSWNRANEFCKRLSELEKQEYRLPTEEEWEYACRAGGSTAFFFGNDEKDLGNFAWYKSNAGGMIHPVGGKTPNAWGLYDMLGNVWEWCADPFRETYADTQPVTELGVQHRVIRGGAMDGGPGATRSAFRRGLTAGGAYPNIGFRVVAAVKKAEVAQQP
ncbi:MAG TPA: SUMF1/EgtB/PvdO family nonheme iron enzyme [Candidatus Brocadiia bacterium]|nr:SUMF1/EgtB/PvdO family nonheme iron enzyme [Candidatus Brocadiia bacterium]